MFYTHLVFSLFIALLSAKLFGIEQLYFIFIIALFGIIPDIDTHKSKVKIPILSFILKTIFKHRGIFHSVFIPILLFFVLSYLGYYIIGLAVLLGYLSHIFLDALTPSGIRLFWPLRFKVKGFIKTNSIMEKALFILLSVITIFMIIK